MTLFDGPSNPCDRCPRLHSYLQDLNVKYPEGHNGPVTSFGSIESELLIVGLAPGAKGANYTGRPFTGDHAGDVLYGQLSAFGFSKGVFKQHINDGLELVNCRITNAVRCVPPQNKPIGSEINSCNLYLSQEIAAMKRLRIILSLGKISHDAVLKVFGLKQSTYKFTHGAQHQIKNDLWLFDTYHCSRYNMNTRRLTEDMFAFIFSNIQTKLANFS